MFSLSPFTPSFPKLSSYILPLSGALHGAPFPQFLFPLSASFSFPSKVLDFSLCADKMGQTERSRVLAAANQRLQEWVEAGSSASSFSDFHQNQEGSFCSLVPKMFHCVLGLMDCGVPQLLYYIQAERCIELSVQPYKLDLQTYALPDIISVKNRSPPPGQLPTQSCPVPSLQ